MFSESALIARRSSQIALALVFILVALVSRFLPHPPNFTAVGALALFSPALFVGAKLNRAFAILIPLAVLFLSDLALGFYPDLTFVYLGFALVAFLGLFLCVQKGWGRALVGALSASLIFFAVSNFGVWLTAGLYPKTAAGLAECFAMALPFAGYQFAGDLIFVLGFAVASRALRVIPSVVSAPTSQLRG